MEEVEEMIEQREFQAGTQILEMVRDDANRHFFFEIF